MAAQPAGNARLLDRFEPCRNPGLAEVFLRQAPGTSISAARKITEPSGFLISLVVVVNAISP
jgi:hypothetical protein